jgi:hypothetical protein
MKIGVINSAWFGSVYQGRPGLQKTKEIGFQTVDILADPLSMSDADYRQLLKDVQDVGLPVPSTICVAFGLHDFQFIDPTFPSGSRETAHRPG